MKKTTVVTLVLAMAVALGYLLGTESGRQQKEIILVKLRGEPDGEASTADAAA